MHWRPTGRRRPWMGAGWRCWSRRRTIDALRISGAPSNYETRIASPCECPPESKETPKLCARDWFPGRSATRRRFNLFDEREVARVLWCQLQPQDWQTRTFGIIQASAGTILMTVGTAQFMSTSECGGQPEEPAGRQPHQDRYQQRERGPRCVVGAAVRRPFRISSRRPTHLRKRTAASTQLGLTAPVPCETPDRHPAKAPWLGGGRALGCTPRDLAVPGLRLTDGRRRDVSPLSRPGRPVSRSAK
jgi:hypothetical protein